MHDPTGDLQRRRHCLSDWLALHELDAETCRSLLEATPAAAACGTDARARSNPTYRAPDLEAAWLRIAEAMRDFLPEHRGAIDDTFENSARIPVEHRGESRKALTLDNGPDAYPTILFSYRGEPADSMVLAHEFGHALQIRASRGKFVAPIIREVCAFLGESALLSHTRQRHAEQYADFVRVWQAGNYKYFGAQRERLRAALLQPDAPYKYSWNYPVSRYLAIQVSEQCSRDWIWSLFEGEVSVRGVLRELAFATD
jgi:hypothetical protein